MWDGQYVFLVVNSKPTSLNYFHLIFFKIIEKFFLIGGSQLLSEAHESNLRSFFHTSC